MMTIIITSDAPARVELSDDCAVRLVVQPILARRTSRRRMAYLAAPEQQVDPRSCSLATRATRHLASPRAAWAAGTRRHAPVWLQLSVVVSHHANDDDDNQN